MNHGKVLRHKAEELPLKPQFTGLMAFFHAHILRSGSLCSFQVSIQAVRLSVMHAIKGGWVGQTFALAKHNESEGRKSRIRRSKEERKEMVESFIKKYQKSNNGKFPSLNLTHKEVGGSFYTVREIVRDIIQENRVLGPAKFDMEEQSSDQFLEQGPLGSIASDPQKYLVRSSNEIYIEPNNLQDTGEEVLLDSDGLYAGTEHQMADNGQVINGSQVELANKVSNEVTSPKLQVRETLAPKQNAEQELATPLAKVAAVTADVIVETFPLRPVTRTTDETEEGFKEVIDLSNSPHKKMEVFDMEQGKDRSDINDMGSAKNSTSFDEKSVDNPGNLVSEKKSGSGDEEEDKNLGETLVHSTEQSTHTKHFDYDPQAVLPDQSVETSETIEQSHIDEAAARNVQDGFGSKNLTNSYTGETEATKAVQKNANDQRADSQLGSSYQKRSSQTLDRINLESWDGAHKKSVKPEANPFLTIFRALVDAFVKFWSD
ncbi:hypothetical protein L6164_006880 [Bauhinia variegata]|uniref:Uncharacterized protein n=1 Tax=Bauhinia variegata TaxID=167791 RepID=A0ACB9PV12_BAUVA|nr:hypothetical protein L6164_006880 [Bauhinia variegata]